MRIFGIIIIIAGIAMLAFNGFNFQTEKKVAEIGPIQIDKKENHSVTWPSYAGIVAIVVGAIVVGAGGSKR